MKKKLVARILSAQLIGNLVATGCFKIVLETLKPCMIGKRDLSFLTTKHNIVISCCDNIGFTLTLFPFSESTVSAKSVAEPKEKKNRNNKRIPDTDALERSTNKKLKGSSTSSTKTKQDVTPVTLAQGTNFQVKRKTPAENTKATEMIIASPEEKKGSSLSTINSSQTAENLAGRIKAQSRYLENADDVYSTDSDCQQKPKRPRDPSKSQITGLKPDDPAYVEGTNAVTKSIVDLWKEIIKEKSNAARDKDRTARVLKNFDLQELEKCDTKGYNALTKACSLPSMSPPVVYYLIKTKKEHGRQLDVNSRLPDQFQRDDEKARWLIPGMSALSVAIRRGNVKCVSTFMNRETEINFRSTDCDGNTALHHCALSPDIPKTAFTRLFECFKPLEWRDMRNRQGKNPFDIALEQWKQTDAKKEGKKKEDLENVLNIMDPSKIWKNQ